MPEYRNQEIFLRNASRRESSDLESSIFKCSLALHTLADIDNRL